MITLTLDSLCYTFTVYTAGSERVRITSDGKFGIGTNNPGDVLTMAGTDGFY